MGPSGSGKSTLMHILAALDRPTSGYVTIAGTRLGNLSDTDITKLRRQHIGFVFQFFNLLPMLSAEENILLPLSIAGRKPDKAEFEELLKKVGLAIGASTVRRSSPAASSSASRSRARSSPSRPSSSPTSRPETWTRRRAARSSSSCTTLSTPTVRPSSWSRTRRAPRRSPIVSSSSPTAASSATWAKSSEDEIIDDDQRQSTLELIRVCAERACWAEAPRRADRDRDRARGRDGQRYLRLDRLDRQGLRLDLHGRPQGLERRSSRVSSAFRLSERWHDGAADFDESLLAGGAGAARRRSRRAERRRRGAADRRRRQGDRLRRRAEPRLQHRERRFPLQPADARRRRLARPRRGRHRPLDGRTRSTSRSGRDRRPGRGAGSSGFGSRASSNSDPSPRSAARPSPGSPCRPRSACSSEQGKLDEIAVAAKPAVSDAAAHSTSIRADPARRRRRCDTSAEQAAGRRAGTNEFISFLQNFLLVFAGIALFVGSFVIANSLSITIAQRTREFATHAHAWRLAPAGSRLDRGRGARHRRGRVRRRSLPRPRPREAPLLALRRGRLHAAEQRASLRDAHDRGRAARRSRSSRSCASLRPAIRATRVPPIAAVREGATLPESALCALPDAGVGDC